jgi:hypothetical protein
VEDSAVRPHPGGLKEENVCLSVHLTFKGRGNIDDLAVKCIGIASLWRNGEGFV